MSKKSTVAVLLALFTVLQTFAQNAFKISPETSKSPIIDGTVTKDEYSFAYTMENLTLYLSRTKDRLYVAVAGNTTGWVAMGAGSSRMNNAFIFMGYSAGGTAFFSEQKGSGHTHSEIPEKNRITSRHTVSEKDAVTTLEFECPVSSFITAGQKQLDVIMALGRSDSFYVQHSTRRGLTISLE